MTVVGDQRCGVGLRRDVVVEGFERRPELRRPSEVGMPLNRGEHPLGIGPQEFVVGSEAWREATQQLPCTDTQSKTLALQLQRTAEQHCICLSRV